MPPGQMGATIKPATSCSIAAIIMRRCNLMLRLLGETGRQSVIQFSGRIKAHVLPPAHQRRLRRQRRLRLEAVLPVAAALALVAAAVVAVLAVAVAAVVVHLVPSLEALLEVL